LDIKQLIIDNGAWFYAITFAWTFLEGETFVIFAGAATSQGMLNIYVLIAVAWIGSFCGDQLYFFIGRRYGKRLLSRFPRLQGGVLVALDMLHKYHVVFILTYRFIYGVRNFASFAMGMSDLKWSRFVGLNFIAAFVWANTFAWGGYVLGVAFEAALGDIAADFGYIMLGVFALVAVLFVFLHFKGKKRFKAAVERAKATETIPGVSAPGDLPKH
jgi:membrane protein DedA with SNARE-associated domain